MKIKHIKSVKLVTDASEMWTISDYADPERYYVVFEVSDEFARAFASHMRSILHAQDIYESGLGADEVEEWEMLATFIYDGASWFFSDDGKSLIRSCEYEDLFEKEVPEDWWMSVIAIMKEVLAKV